MESKHKITIGLIVLAAIIIPSILAAFSYNKAVEEEKQESLIFIPGNWTPELVTIYNDSDPIELLEFKPFHGIIINDDCESINKAVLVAIPDQMEDRGSFGTYTHSVTWDDENVLIGNTTKSYEKNLRVAYVFTNMNISNDLYDRIIAYYHPALNVIEVEIVTIDLTQAQSCETVTIDNNYSL